MTRKMLVPITSLIAALTVVGTAGVANAAHSIELGDSATIVSKGAAVLVPVEVTCEPTPFPPFPFPGGSSVSVSVNQRHGNRIAHAHATAPVVCDNSPHVVEVLLRAYPTPFHQGPALATASMFLCDSTGCHEASDTEEIDLSKA